MKNISLLFLVIAVITGCTTTQPALSIADTASLESFPVKGRQGLLINQQLSFGDYQTSRVKRSWTRGGNTRIGIPMGNVYDIKYPDLISMEYINRDQAFYFQIQDVHGNHSDVYSVSQFASKDLRIGDNPNSIINILEDIFGMNDFSADLFYLQLFLNDENRPWQLILDNHAAQMFADRYRGVFALDQENFYTLEPITKVMGKNGPKDLVMGSIGYEILNRKNEPVAAVSLVNGGNVYFNTSDTKERFLLANLCAALLLQEDIAEN